jgi:hypothetical protein
MTTSGTSIFNLEFTEIAEESWERAGREMRTGYDLRTARRSMNLMTIEWQNRGINMWTIEQGVINLVQGVNTYALPNDTIDLLEHVIRTGAGNVSTQSDLSITRISVSTYATIPNKLQQARPIQLWIQRMSGQENLTAGLLSSTITSTATTITLSDVTALPAAGFIRLDSEVISYGYITTVVGSTQGTLSNCGRGQQDTFPAAHTAGAAVYWAQVPAVTVWPTPDQGTAASPYYQLAYWRMRRIQDAGAGVEIADMNFRFLPCVVAGLAYYIGMKVPELAPRIPMLKAAYDEQFDLAAGEDREKAAIRFVPRRSYIGGG